jgi:hypothetical protein
VRTPEEALAAARSAALAAGSESRAEEQPVSVEPVALRRLAEWAILAPDVDYVYSTRRLGGPITALKRLLVRLLQQYIGQLAAQQSRFNAQVAAHVLRLEERVRALEEARDGADERR